MAQIKNSFLVLILLISMPSFGFAFELPNGWYYLDPKLKNVIIDPFQNTVIVIGNTNRGGRDDLSRFVRQSITMAESTPHLGDGNRVIIAGHGPMAPDMLAEVLEDVNRVPDLDTVFVAGCDTAVDARELAPHLPGIPVYGHNGRVGRWDIDDFVVTVIRDPETNTFIAPSDAVEVSIGVDTGEVDRHGNPIVEVISEPITDPNANPQIPGTYPDATDMTPNRPGNTEELLTRGRRARAEVADLLQRVPGPVGRAADVYDGIDTARDIIRNPITTSSELAVEAVAMEVAAAVVAEYGLVAGGVIIAEGAAIAVVAGSTVPLAAASALAFDHNLREFEEQRAEMIETLNHQNELSDLTDGINPREACDYYWILVDRYNDRMDELTQTELDDMDDIQRLYNCENVNYDDWEFEGPRVSR